MLGAVRLAIWRYWRRLLRPFVKLWFGVRAGIAAGIAAASRDPDIDLEVAARAAGARKKPLRVFMDGAFDLMHFGHMNAFRQGKALGDYLLVGVNDDASIAECKGLPPVLNDSERQAAVSGCRFVDEIIPGSPYVMSEEYIQYLIDTHDVDIFVHGDDPCIVDGRDVYEAAKKAGRYMSIPRTEGISTTDIVGRMLLMTSDHHDQPASQLADSPAKSVSEIDKDFFPELCAGAQSKFLVTSQLMQLFRADLRKCESCAKRIVYVDGAWDMFHAGHIDFLARARELGDFLIVGVHSDQVVNQHRGGNHPILTMHERLLGLLGCKYVDDVLLNAPWIVTQDMISTLNIAVVARGVVRDCEEAVEQSQPHAVPESMGILVELQSGSDLTLEKIMERLKSRRDAMSERYKDKQKREADFWKQKHRLQ